MFRNAVVAAGKLQVSQSLVPSPGVLERQTDVGAVAASKKCVPKTEEYRRQLNALADVVLVPSFRKKDEAARDKRIHSGVRYFGGTGERRFDPRLSFIQLAGSPVAKRDVVFAFDYFLYLTKTLESIANVG
jgi:hypothetical protein